MKSSWDRKIIFAKIDKRKLRPLFLNCRNVLEKEVGHKVKPTDVARCVLLLGRGSNKKDKMDNESLEELLYLIEVCEEKK